MIGKQLSAAAVAAVVLLTACAARGSGPAQQPAPDARAIVGLEAEFAAASRARGAREAFLAFLDEDAIVLQPGPVWGRAAWESAGDLPGTLDWSPDWAGVAEDDALAFATGRWLLTPSADGPATEGRYLTVWRRGAAGWRVVFDGGFGRRPEGAARLPAGAVRLDTGPCEPGPAVPPGELQLLDAMLSGSAAKPHARRMLERLAADAVLYHAPVAEGFQGDAARLEALQALPAATQLWPMGTAIATSGDLGYSYGLSAPGTDAAADASYAHVWCRTGGDWRLLLQLRTRLPK
jgi:ketosteroid isomerase-like protein